MVPHCHSFSVPFHSLIYNSIHQSSKSRSYDPQVTMRPKIYLQSFSFFWDLFFKLWVLYLPWPMFSVAVNRLKPWVQFLFLKKKWKLLYILISGTLLANHITQFVDLKTWETLAGELASFWYCIDILWRIMGEIGVQWPQDYGKI